MKSGPHKSAFWIYLHLSNELDKNVKLSYCSALYLKSPSNYMIRRKNVLVCVHIFNFCAEFVKK